MQLGQLRGSEEFQRLVARAQLVVQDLGVVGAATGQALQGLFGTYLQQVRELT